MIFSRGRGSGRHAAGPSRGGRDRARRREADERDQTVPEPDEAPVDERGPYDISEAPDGVHRIDLGSLHIPALDGVEVRVQANPDGAIQQVMLVHGDSALQLGVFAAPRTAGIWDEVREEIRSSLYQDGVAAQEAEGDYGTELRARVRAPEGLTDLRFIGIDGPRWMVRAVYQGRAATEREQEGPLAECLAGLVVDRGREAMPTREALPLRLPRDIAEQAAAQQAAAGEVTEPPAVARTIDVELPGDAPPPGTPRPRPIPGGTARSKPSPRSRRSR